MRQTLINSHYPIKVIDEQVKVLLQRFMNSAESEDKKNKILFYFKGQITSNYIIEEKRLLKIVNDSTQPTDEISEINMRVYYKNFKLVNAIKTKTDKFQSSHNVVYRYTCIGALVTMPNILAIQRTYYR